MLRHVMSSSVSKSNSDMKANTFLNCISTFEFTYSPNRHDVMTISSWVKTFAFTRGEDAEKNTFECFFKSTDKINTRYFY